MSEQAKSERVELTEDMLGEVTGGTIYYKADGSKIDGMGKYKLEGIMYNGRYGILYLDNLDDALKFAQNTGISKDMVEIP